MQSLFPLQEQNPLLSFCLTFHLCVTSGYRHHSFEPDVTCLDAAFQPGFGSYGLCAKYSPSLLFSYSLWPNNFYSFFMAGKKKKSREYYFMTRDHDHSDFTSINKVFLELSHAHLHTCYLWARLPGNHRVAQLWQETGCSTKPEILLSGPCQKKFADLCSEPSAWGTYGCWYTYFSVTLVTWEYLLVFIQLCNELLCSSGNSWTQKSPQLMPPWLVVTNWVPLSRVCGAGEKWP